MCPSLVDDACKISIATGLTYQNEEALQGAAAFVKAAFGYEVDDWQFGSVQGQILGFQRASWLLSPDGIDIEEFKQKLFPPEWGSNSHGGKADGCFTPPGFGLTNADAAEVFEKVRCLFIQPYPVPVCVP